MKRGDPRAAGTVLALVFAAASGQAQEVHKCIVNGTVNYQATPCPSGDVVLQAPPTPSDQETRQARGDLYRQRFEAATGLIVRPSTVPPRPSPPPPPRPAAVTVTTTTTTIVAPGEPGLILRQTTSRSTPVLPPPKTNCEKLDRDYSEAADRREQIRVATDLPSHAQALQKADDDAARIRQLATAANCHLAR